MTGTNWKQINYVLINADCMRRYAGLLAMWLPDGKAVQGEWVARNPTRDDRKAGSFKINMHTGRWADFATGDGGGDPVSLYAYLKGLSQSDAARALQADWGAGR